MSQEQQFQCDTCAESFDNKIALKNHKANVHVLVVTVGESKLLIPFSLHFSILITFHRQADGSQN